MLVPRTQHRLSQTRPGKGLDKDGPVKLAGIRNWLMPKTVKDVRSFHGFCNFYHSFIQGFSKITLPLNALTKKGVEFKWMAAAQRAFDTLKEKMTEAPVLALVLRQLQAGVFCLFK
jgi:hypothetical protein